MKQLTYNNAKLILSKMHLGKVGADVEEKDFKSMNYNQREWINRKWKNKIENLDNKTVSQLKELDYLKIVLTPDQKIDVLLTILS